jgi:restriction system protein
MSKPSSAQVSYRRRGELMRALFEILRAEPEGLRAQDALASLAQRLPPTQYESEQYASGSRRFEKIVRFTTIPFVKAGWLVKDGGRWVITEAGRTALLKHQDPERFLRTALGEYRAWKKAQPSVDPDDELEEEEPEASAGITLEQAEEQAWAEIERYLGAMPPFDFQQLVAALLGAMGYHVGWIAPPGKDGGVDILAFNDPLGTTLPRIKVQVKRQQQKVAVDGLRAFMALLGNDDVGIFVNTGGFTRDAVDEARSQTTRRVTLVDLERLMKLWTEHYSKLDEGARRRLPLQPIYFLAPES